MLNRNDIIAHMSAFDYDKSRYWISTGAAMVMHGVREFTHDIDVGCEHDVAEALIKSGCRTSRFPDGGVKIQFDDVIEVYEDWSRGDVVMIDSLPVLSLQSIIHIKRILGREKDFRDIELIENFLGIVSPSAEAK